MPGAVQIYTAGFLPHSACGTEKHESNKSVHEKQQSEGQEALTNMCSARAELSYLSIKIVLYVFISGCECCKEIGIRLKKLIIKHQVIRFHSII